MGVKVNESTFVYPAEDTPKGCLWLSRLDMMIRQPFSHTRVLYIYPRPTSVPYSTFFNVDILKKSLSKALVPFYPLAGRLKMNETNGRYEIDCNAKGALFVEAETTCTLNDLGEDIKLNSKLNRELIPTCDYSKGLSSFPLFIVQFTRFGCGGMTLGFGVHHHAGDGTSYTHFVNSWATLARGLELNVLPCHDRAAYLAPHMNPPQVNFRHLEYEPSFPPVSPKNLSGESITLATEHQFKLSEEQVKALKQIVMSNEKVVSYKPSTFKVIAAHVRRSVCKARELAYDQDVKLYIHTNGRSKLKDPALPKGYFGNVIFFSSCVAKAGDLINNPLWYTVGKIDEAMRKMDDADYVRSAVDYLESQEDLTTLVRGAHSVTSPNLQINSWTGLPFSGANFGWGGPNRTALGEIKSEGQSKIMSSVNEEKCLYVAIKLFALHMALFQKYFYISDLIPLSKI